MTLQHFSEKLPLAVCGLDLDPTEDGRFTLLYDATTSAFKQVTCPACRNWIHDHKLAPGGFQDPMEWHRAELRAPLGKGLAVVVSFVEAKTMMRQADGAPHYQSFLSLLADRLHDEGPALAVVLAVQLLTVDISRNRDGYTGKPLRSHLVGLQAVALETIVAHAVYSMRKFFPTAFASEIERLFFQEDSAEAAARVDKSPAVLE